MKKIQIELDEISHNSKVSLDDKELPCVTGLQINAEAGSLATATIDVFITDTSVELPFDKVELVGKLNEELLIRRLQRLLDAVESNNEDELSQEINLTRSYLLALEKRMEL